MNIAVAYSGRQEVLHAVQLCWPEFGLVDFQDAIATYQRRQRRFGT
ncbi:hypothetical protein ACFONN_12610 [Dyella humi]|uniref:Undecaprenyl diphosphate synthase family protein n=1 Tax=Dyella humi TaxID=1770547 RepID=A0ABW8INI9_9GAMM